MSSRRTTGLTAALIVALAPAATAAQTQPLNVNLSGVAAAAAGTAQLDDPLAPDQDFSGVQVRLCADTPDVAAAITSVKVELDATGDAIPELTLTDVNPTPDPTGGFCEADRYRVYSANFGDVVARAGATGLRVSVTLDGDPLTSDTVAIPAADTNSGGSNNSSTGTDTATGRPIGLCDQYYPDTATQTTAGRLVAQRLNKTQGADTIRLGMTGTNDGTIVMAFGPNGVLLGSPPEDRREHHQLAIILYQAAVRTDTAADGTPGRTTSAPYRVAVTGCQEVPSVRVVGDLSAAMGFRLESPQGAHVEVQPLVVFTGQCSGDSPVQVQITVPEIEDYCATGERTATIQTTRVHQFSVGAGLGVFPGTQRVVGLDPGVGGNPGVVYDRHDTIGAVPLAYILWHPWGTSPGLPAFEQRFAFGTAIQINDPLRSFSVLVAFEVFSGLEVFLGYEFLHRERRLAGGLQAGDVFVGDSTLVPTSDEYVFSAANGFYLGVGATTELVRMLLGGN